MKLVSFKSADRSDRSAFSLSQATERGHIRNAKLADSILAAMATDNLFVRPAAPAVTRHKNSPQQKAGVASCLLEPESAFSNVVTQLFATRWHLLQTLSLCCGDMFAP
mmetsp:Transcript_1955/g.5173  ORF Transcript_1955/g.5173 Transcript_1955/m.5173 type:complete len:108 (-) Transcript_1955:346-669(-)